jgi:serine protease Do
MLKDGNRKWVLGAALAAVFAFGAVAEQGLHTAWTKLGATPVTVKIADSKLPAAGFASVIQKDLPAVVNISTSRVVKTAAEGPFGDPMFRQFFGRGFQMPQKHKESALGSGVIVSPEGYILTNNHVVDGAQQIIVTLSDKRDYQAKLIGADPKTDVALLKINASNLPVLAFADSKKVRVGDYALAIGNPFGIGQTVTLGIVSATGRGGLGIEDYEDFIQTDAAINPGNSGGALVNSDGDLIGINTAIISPNSGGNNGVGFAIPSNMARNVMEELAAHGKVTRGYMGVMLQPVTPAIAKAFGMKETAGALVAEVSPDSPASRAGLKNGDIITQVNETPVADNNQLKLLVGSLQPGTTADLKVFRNGSTVDTKITLAELPSTTARAGREQGGDSNALDGVELSDLTPEILGELRLPARTLGVVVTNVDPESPAAEAGLQRGDVIQSINRKPVDSVEHAQQLLANSARQSTLLLVNRGGQTMFVVVEAK